jgi:hypothetical protein
MTKNSVCLAIAFAGLASFGVAEAVTLSVNPGTSSPSPGGTVTGAQLVVADTVGARGWNLTLDVPLGLTATNVVPNAAVLGALGSCSFNPGTSRIIVLAGNFATDLPPGVACTFDLVVGGGAVIGDVFNLEPVSPPGCDPNPPNVACTTTLVDQDPVTAGIQAHVLTVSDVPTPRTLSYGTPTGSLITFDAGAAPGTPAPGQTITVTAAGNEGTATLTACSAPAPFSVSPTSLSFADATPGPFDLTVGCTYPTSNATGALTCTQTNAGAAATQVSWNLSCPAPNVGPTISAVPASGSNVAVSAGSVGTQGQATIDLQAAGGSGGGSTDISCTSTGNVLIAAAPGTPAGQGPVAQTVTGTAQPTDLRVGVVLTAASQPAAGTITCTVSGQADLTWTVSAPAGSTFTPPEVIPSASTWSKIALFGLLGIFGLMAVGFRRQG